MVIREEFFKRVEYSLPLFKAKFPDPGVLLRELLAKRVTIGLLGKLAYDILEVFYAEPMLVIDPALSADAYPLPFALRQHPHGP